jgi:hypothetical protein
VLLKRDENTAKYKEVHPNCREDSSWRTKRGWDIDNEIKFTEYNVQVQNGLKWRWMRYSVAFSWWWWWWWWW